ncbi:TOBE domain-containing protein [Sphaerospermopsis kisseleviana NIES-73]|nr:TOBE domain-containing protein [Sphaerospermopsis kisseleviana NIES-73]
MITIGLIINNNQEDKNMQVSARNALKGTVKKVLPGLVNSEVIIEIAPGVEVTSIITKTSADNLKIQEGSQVYAVIKATDVIIATD